MPEDKKKTALKDQTIILSDSELMYSIYQKQSGALPVPYIACEQGDLKGKRFLLAEDELSIGRGEQCNIVLDDPTVSGLHAVIYKEGDHVYIRDEGSKNGTFVNDKKVQSIRLSMGDHIRIGRSTFKMISPP